MEKKKRLGILQRLIEEGQCSDQQSLMDAMKAEGCDVTQSTLSRDLAELKVKKIRLGKGRFRYELQKKETEGYTRIHETIEDPNEEKHWFVMFTRIYKEQTSVEELTELGIEAWIPLITVKKKWSDRIKIQKKPAITRIVFVHCSEKTRLAQSFVANTLGYMSDRLTHRPVIIPDRQMKDFQTVIEQNELAVTFTEEKLQPGKKVRIAFGSLAGIEAELIEVKDADSNVIVRLENLGCACVKVPLDSLEPA